MRSSNRVLLHFFVLFFASYAIGVIFLHYTVSFCKAKNSTDGKRSHAQVDHQRQRNEGAVQPDASRMKARTEPLHRKLCSLRGTDVLKLHLELEDGGILHLINSSITDR